MRQLLVLSVLLLLMQVAARFGASTQGPFDATILLTAGFILIGAYTLGELFRRVRLPALLGYLAAGILFGPKLATLVLGTAALAPISGTAVGELGLINVLAVGVIGTLGGGEIHLTELRENIGKLALICVGVFACVLPSVAVVVLGLSFVAPTLVPFLAELSTVERVAGAALFGILAVGMSPAATLALLQEVRARGRFTSLVLGVVVLGDLVLVASFLLILALAKLAVSPEGLSWASVGASLPVIAAEFGWALAIGLAVGAIYILYLRFVRREVLLFSLAVVFVTAFVCARLHAETLLAFLVGGFVVQNASRHGHVLLDAFERISLPVFVIYFTTQAAALDLTAITAYLPLTAILVTVRVALLWAGVGLGARAAGVDEGTRAHLQLSFVSQGGVDLVLAAMVAEALPGFGAQIQLVTVATVLVYVIVGPPLLARALDAVGESEAARERGAEALESHGPAQTHASPGAVTVELVRPREDGSVLGRRIASLYASLVALRERWIVAEILGRARQRRWVVDRLAGEIERALVEPEIDGARELDEAIATAGREHAHATLEPFDGQTLVRLFHELDAAQPFDESHRVAIAAALYEPAGSRGVRAIRWVRRVRRSIVGPGMRTVALGRLWRYHVTLDVPLALWTNLRPAEAELWHALLEHARHVRAALAHAAAHPDDAAALDQARTVAAKRSLAIRERLAELDAGLAEGLDRALAQAWSNFLAAAELAGTLEHPAWRHRPSSRHDVARAATAQILERSSDDRERAAGRFDAMLAVANANLVARVIRDAAESFEAAFADALAELDDEFALCFERARTSGHAQLLDALARMGRHVDLLRRQLLAVATAEVPGLRRILAETPELLRPSNEIADDGELGQADPRRTELRLRAWLSQTLVQEFAGTRTAAVDELGDGLVALRRALMQIAQVIDYHAEPAHDDDEEAGLDARIVALLERAQAQVEALARVARAHVDAQIDGAERRALAPILGHRWDEVRRRLRSIEDSPRAAMIEWLRERGQALSRSLDTTRRELGEELTALIAGRPSPRADAAWRAALLGPRATMPESYQRLFTSVPAETAGLLIERAQLGELEAQAARWLAGSGRSMLVYGERGAGKRTLARQLLARLGERVEAKWLRLTPAFDREAQLARELAITLGLAQRSTEPSDDLDFDFTALGRLIVAELEPKPERPPLIVIENAERLLRRTPEGLAQVRRFLAMISLSSDRIAWVVLMAEPTVRLLDAALELRARFPAPVHVPPMTSAELEQVLDTRHRLSGYELRVEAPRPNLATWLRTPGAAWRMSGARRDAGFELLARLSGGNVRQALRLWLVAARIDADAPGRVVIGPLPSESCPLLESLPLSSRQLLAALMLLGPLPRADLLGIHGQQALDLSAELARLGHLGLVNFDRSNPDLGLVVGVETRLVQPLTAELSACNLL